MTTTEFSNEFDVLYNNAMSNQAPGLDEYEKSVFLTKAQDQLVIDYFNNRVDGVGGGFDGSQKRQYDFSGLIRVKNLYNINTFKERIDNTEKLDKRSLVYLFPPDYFLAVNELLSDSKYQYSIVPLDYATYQRLMMKPYNFPVKRAAWRLFTDKKNCNYWEKKETLENQEDGSVIEEVMYSFLTTWADKKRNIDLTISAANMPLFPTTTDDFVNKNYCVGRLVSGLDDHEHDAVSFEIEGWTDFTIIANTKWSTDNKTYKIVLELYYVATENLDDEEVVEAIKECFDYLNKHPEKFGEGIESLDGIENDLAKAITHTDGFSSFVAPSKFKKFDSASNPEGYNIKTTVTQLPIAEIIGKFATGEIPNYQLRYVRTLTPIVLENLDNYGDDLTIRGYSTITECLLPEECHQEILERAVTLAKIAYSGSTDTIARANQRQKRNND